MPGRRTPSDEGLWPEHLPALTAFLAVANQWRCVTFMNGTVHYQGLDYGAAESGLGLAGIDLTPETWAEVRLIEAGAREELNRVR